MFCKNCGAQMDDNATVCGYCGTALENCSSEKMQSFKVVDPEKKVKNKKRIKLFICLIAVAAVALIAINVISEFVGYKGTVRKIMNAYESYDIDTLVSLTSDIRLDVFDWYGDDYATDYYKDIVSDDLDYYEKNVGHKYKLSYKITKTHETVEGTADAILDSLEYCLEDVGNYDISKVMYVEVNITAKEGKISTDVARTLYLTKEDGSWKLYDIDETR